MLLLKKIIMLKAQAKISSRETLIFFPRGNKEKMQYWLLIYRFSHG